MGNDVPKRKQVLDAASVTPGSFRYTATRVGGSSVSVRASTVFVTGGQEIVVDEGFAKARAVSRNQRFGAGGMPNLATIVSCRGCFGEFRNFTLALRRGGEYLRQTRLPAGPGIRGERWRLSEWSIHSPCALSAFWCEGGLAAARFQKAFVRAGRSVGTDCSFVSVLLADIHSQSLSESP